jgi:hypothetical protein
MTVAGVSVKFAFHRHKLDSEGRLLTDVFTFELQNPLDAERLTVGEVVEVGWTPEDS